MKRLNLTNQKFGRLTVIKFIGSDKRGRTIWLCLCDCGKEKIIAGTNLGLHTNSCGCLRKELFKQLRQNQIGILHPSYKHGCSGSFHNKATKEYDAWQHMKERCLNLNDKHYLDYGGRGIKVCDHWLNSFENFLADVGKAPGKEYSLDRMDVNGNYEPGNVKWATIREQANNKRNKRIEQFTTKELQNELLHRNPWIWEEHAELVG